MANQLANCMKTQHPIFELRQRQARSTIYLRFLSVLIKPSLSRLACFSLVMLALIDLAGCASGPRYTPPPSPPNADMVTLIIYRKVDSYGGFGAIRFIIDDQIAADLKPNQYSYFHIQAGKHKISVAGDSLRKEMAKYMEFLPNKTHYLKYEVKENRGLGQFNLLKGNEFFSPKELVDFRYQAAFDVVLDKKSRMDNPFREREPSE